MPVHQTVKQSAPPSQLVNAARLTAAAPVVAVPHQVVATLAVAAPQAQPQQEPVRYTRQKAAKRMSTKRMELTRLKTLEVHAPKPRYALRSVCHVCGVTNSHLQKTNNSGSAQPIHQPINGSHPLANKKSRPEKQQMLRTISALTIGTTAVEVCEYEVLTTHCMCVCV